MTELSTEPEFIDIGMIAIGDSIDTLLTLRSVGNTALAISSLSFSNNVFESSDLSNDTLSAYGDAQLILRYRASVGGAFRDTLIIENSAGDPVRVPLAAGATVVESDQALIPTEFFLDQNYPNPFNPSTTIRFGVPRASDVSIEVYDVLGRTVANLVSGRVDAGYYTARWSCDDCPSGVYLARMVSPNFVSVRKLLLLK
ncbi:MAG: T9SS type A sorting domain-containing protein [bacterium]|nr:T9SS type A sorting domain-containing protein [bacterium]